MKQFLVLIGGLTLLLLLAACGATQTTEPAAAPQEAEQIEQAQPDTAVLEAPMTEEMAEPAEETEKAVAAKPQLIEFYADW